MTEIQLRENPFDSFFNKSDISNYGVVAQSGKKR